MQANKFDKKITPKETHNYRAEITGLDRNQYIGKTSRLRFLNKSTE